MYLLSESQECPTWWRLYVYVTDEARTQILDERRPKRDLELGKGAEGYIAEDEWCYNCGEVGHWGDVRFNLFCFFIPFLYLIVSRTVK